jgi:hypothetical protein
VGLGFDPQHCKVNPYYNQNIEEDNVSIYNRNRKL